MANKEKLIEKATKLYEESEGAKQQLQKMASEDEFEKAVEELSSVKGIGESTAKQIAEQMAERSLGIQDLVGLEDMTEIKGIGESTAKDLRDELKKEEKEIVESKEEASEDVKKNKSKKIQPSPTTRKAKQIKKEASAAAKKYIGRSRY